MKRWWVERRVGWHLVFFAVTGMVLWGFMWACLFVLDLLGAR